MKEVTSCNFSYLESKLNFACSGVTFVIFCSQKIIFLKELFNDLERFRKKTILGSFETGNSAFSDLSRFSFSNANITQHKCCSRQEVGKKTSKM